MSDDDLKSRLNSLAAGLEPPPGLEQRVLRSARRRRILVGAAVPMIIGMIAVSAFAVVGPLPSPRVIAPVHTPSPVVRNGMDVVMAFSRRGDIWLALSDGKVQNLTKSPQMETQPTISASGKTVVFVRDESDLVYVELDTGENEVFAQGTWPAYGPLDYLAWTSVDGNIVIGSTKTGAIDSHAPIPEGPMTVEHIAWDQSLEVIYYQVFQGHGSAPYYIDVWRKKGWRCTECGRGLSLHHPVEIYPDNAKRGEEFFSPSLSPGLNVLMVCCRDSEDTGWKEAAIGDLDINDVAVRYWEMQSIDQLPLRLDGSPLNLMYSAQLDAEVRGRRVVWGRARKPSWILSEGTRVWLVQREGHAVELPFRVDGPVAVSPKFSDSPLLP